MFKLSLKYFSNRLEQRGFTLIEIIVVLILLSILAVFSVPKFIDLGENAKIKALEAAVAELNGREKLVWVNTKSSDVGWIDDASLFAQMDCDLGSSYQWKSSAEIDGGKLYYKNQEAKLDRSPSTVISPARWEMSGPGGGGNGGGNGGGGPGGEG